MRYNWLRSLRLAAMLMLLALSLTLAGCSGGGNDGGVSLTGGGGGGVTPPTTGNIAGRVTASGAGTPIQGALVELDPDGATPRTTNSDANGDYAFPDVAAGIHTLRVTAPGHPVWQMSVDLSTGETLDQDVACWPTPGTLVVFQSEADDLVAGDVADGFVDVFVRDLGTGTTTKVSVLPTGKTGGSSGYPVMSDCGRWVVFESYAQLVAADDDDAIDVYRYDRQTATMSCLTLGYQFSKTYCESGDLFPFTSGNGRYTTYEWNVGASEAKYIFVHDGVTGETTLGSVGPPPAGVPNGCSKHPVVAAYGRYIAFDSAATNLIPNDDPTTDRRDIFLYDLLEGVTEKVSMAADGTVFTNECSSWPSISADGRYVAFRSNATNLVDPAAPSGMVYVRDRQAGTTALVSLDSTGAAASSACYRPTISEDGRFVSFETPAALVPEDTNGTNDVYVRDTVANTTALASWNALGTAAGGADSSTSVLASDGSYVLFRSRAQDLVDSQPGSPFAQVFMRVFETALNSMTSVTPGAAPGNGDSNPRETI